MTNYKTDLHIHTCLSPCAELEMTPKNIVRQAKYQGLDIIGICDHNSCENVPYARNAAKDEDIFVIGGMEITTREEVHILALFENDKILFSMQELVYEHLHGENDEALFGSQVIVNENNDAVDISTKLLIGATDISIDYLIQYIHELNGIAIAAHIDRDFNSIISQLGFIPYDLAIDALGLSTIKELEHYRHLHFPLVTFSDAHILNDIGKNYITLSLNQIQYREIQSTIQQQKFELGAL